MFNINFDDLMQEDVGFIKFNINEIKNKLKEHSSQKLCEMITTARYFKFDEELDVCCMEELAFRRISGDNFDFESKLEELNNELNKELESLNAVNNQFDFRKIIKQAMSNK